ncbi:S8 family serine peptidase [Rossellomorea vietnamensis]|uniref:S8 family serine peptidase n=1 Tax=Rossellomorea vietnamensis TaxID=218284 RepID=A0A5D4NVF7_9BACI|nr:cell wall-binding repeat-containing protein [Rossellomorea vietnamensis]TYS17661.1 S8 family serine peptidase [Rossellomorea vietnamensis]
MNRQKIAKKALKVLASATIVASSFAGAATYTTSSASAEVGTTAQKTIESRLLNFKEVQTLANSEDSVQQLIIVGTGTDATKALKKLGVEVHVNYKNFAYLADVPTENIYDIIGLDNVRTIGKNNEEKLGKVNLDEIGATPQGELDEDAVVTPDQLETHPSTGVDDFHDKFSGEGTRVGIIDSGPDPGHESFTNKPANFDTTRKYGSSKIVAVRDYTVTGYASDILEERYAEYLPADFSAVYANDRIAEGDVLFFDELPEGDSILDGAFNTEGIDAENDTFYFGSTQFFNAAADFNADGKYNNNFPVLMADDKVYIDTDQDGDFTDETAYGNNETGTFDHDVTDDLVGVNFRVNDMGFNERYGVHEINLFTDLNGHGSHVAGITAANGPLRGNAYGAVAGEGVAPEAEVVGLRVFQEEGGAATFSIMKAMIDAALPEDLGGFDTDVANLSLGSLPDMNDGSGAYGVLMDVLSEQYDIVFVNSAGNNGPGGDSVGSPGDVGSAISVGAYIDSEMWATEYNAYPYGKDEDGNPLPGEGMWYFSSVGPNQKADMKPDIVAPGSAYAAQPVHQSQAAGQTGYDVLQGTSMSAPYVTGAVALLKSAALKDRLPFDYEIAKEALKVTAKPLEGYNYAEVGSGLIDVPAAYEWMREHMVQKVKDVDVTVYHGEKVSGGPGLFVRNKDIPETVEVLIENNTDEDKNLTIEASEDWFTPSVSSLSLDAGEHEYITVSYDEAKLAEGTNSGMLLIDDSSTPYVEARSTQTIMTGHEFTVENNNRFRDTNEVISSQTNAYTFDVKSGVEELRFSLNAVKENDDYQGVVRMLIFDPDGFQVNEYIGYAGRELNVEDFVQQSPKEGVWEVHVYGITSPEAGKEMAEYTFEAVSQDIVSSPGKIDLGKVNGAEEFNEDITFTNYLKDTANVEFATVGFSGPIKDTVSGTVTEDDDDNLLDGELVEISIKNNVALSASVTTPDSGADLDLFLFNKNDMRNPIAQGATPNDNESFAVSSLPDGEYVIAVDNFGEAGETNDFTLEIAEEKVLSPGEEGAIGSVKADVKTAKLGVGESVTVPVEITTPEEAVNAYAAVYMLDAKTGETLSMVPISTNGDVVTEVSGADRVGTSIAISQNLHPDGYAADHKNKAVVLATGYNFPDALAAGPLATALNAPILAVGSDGKLTDEVLDEIKRLGAENVYIVGGESAVSKAVVNQLGTAKVNPSDIKRLSGATRYDTNLAIVAELQKNHGFSGNGVFLATGTNFADALSAASIAGANDMPIVLTEGQNQPLSDEAKAVLEDEEVYVVGGTAAVSNEVVAQAKSKALSVKRLSGVNRYGTLAALLGEFATGTSKLYVANGKNFPDALSASPLVVDNDGLLVLVDQDAMPKEVDAFLTKFAYQNDINSVTVLGGKAAVGQDVRDALQKKVTE